MRNDVEESGPDEPQGEARDDDPSDDENGRPEKPFRRVWDRPDDRNDPPSQRPEDTVEEERRRREAG